MKIPDPAEQPTMTVQQAGEALGISRSSAYDAVRSGTIPAIRLGRRLVVPTAALRTMCQLDTTETHNRPDPVETWVREREAAEATAGS